ncbi:MAG: L-histidine N(alpha)-methyltransferase [Algoriphagus sp.]|uniref:L-histidine N(alpha)-methyltransferase n=1 Tax=Algoriphagus sp. TaxID=1872435 RepID=UPI0027304F58|nr:L-histidine N(alpha)-methyltransferase [Algoriphagus sp.]MDP2042470.1 L-histidine N(alpha)-methyltransferase [Algoriphagus sp.]MDP3473516.1 L-histidine N(alpha)-methyltransferase [Algoriphagus sp.]
MSLLLEQLVLTQSQLFLKDVIEGLRLDQKELSSKYFYDAEGDLLFQQIMASEDYYLTRCEEDIFRNKTSELTLAITNRGTLFDLIELGAGDGSKTLFLLKELIDQGEDFDFFPIDISKNILEILGQNLQESLPELSFHLTEGDYFEALREIVTASHKRKVVLFLGSNIGNMSPGESLEFCRHLSDLLSPGDLVIMGFDLRKNPATILRAYSDREGITSKFNLNLLRRINRELGGDFNLSQFEHYQSYDPISGACKSYLVSLSDQKVTIGDQIILFKENEPIYMEVSQKFSPEEIDALAVNSGFSVIANWYDSKKWFVDAIWEVQ